MGNIQLGINFPNVQSNEGATSSSSTTRILNSTEQKTQQRVGEGFIMIQGESRSFEETFKDLRRRMEEGRVTYRDAQRMQEMILHNVKVLKGYIIDKASISRLTFENNGKFTLDPSYSWWRAARGLWKRSILCTTSSTSNDDRENILRWVEFLRFSCDMSYAGLAKGTLSQVDLETTRLGLEKLMNLHYQSESPKRYIVPTALRILEETSLNLKNKSDTKNIKFPDEIKNLLCTLGIGNEIKQIGYLSFRLLFLLENFVIGGDYTFLLRLRDHIPCGGAEDNFALALACYFWVNKEEFTSDPEATLKKLKKDLEEGSDGNKFISLASKKMTDVLSVINQQAKELDILENAKQEKESQMIRERCGDALGSTATGISSYSPATSIVIGLTSQFVRGNAPKTPNRSA